MPPPSAAPPSRPLPPRPLPPRLLLLVAAGGAVGTAARAGLSLALPTAPGALPRATLLVNLLGAFALGALLEGLARRGDDTGRRRLVRLGVGTGVLGGFTTYSSLAVEVDLLAGGAPALAVGYGVGSVAAGVVAAAAGVLLASRSR